MKAEKKEQHLCGLCGKPAKYLQVVKGLPTWVCGSHDNKLGWQNLMKFAGMTYQAVKEWQR